MGEDQPVYRTHSYRKDLKYFGLAALAALALAAVAFVARYDFIRDFNHARESMGVENVKGKPDISNLINLGE